MIRRPPRSTLFPSRRSSDLQRRQPDWSRRADNDFSESFALNVVEHAQDRKSTRLNSSHVENSYAVFCLKKKNLYFSSTFSTTTTRLGRLSTHACSLFSPPYS